MAGTHALLNNPPKEDPKQGFDFRTFTGYFPKKVTKKN
jgi:hypothetical protein